MSAALSPALSVVPMRPYRAVDPQRQLLESVKQLVIDALPSPGSKRVYAAALEDFLTWLGGRPFVKAMVNAYRAHLEAAGLSGATINVRLSAVRKLAAEAADNGLMNSELAAGIARAKGKKCAGVRTGNWLTRAQAEALLNTPDVATLKGKRDACLLALLIGCGLRRQELASLTFAHVQQRDGRWCIVDLIGKGGRTRTVPMPSWAKVAIDTWAAAAGIRDEHVLRPVNKADRLSGSGVTAQAVFKTVRECAGAAGLNVAPHDLRRTFAKLAHKGNAPLEQIQISLGHSSIQTTERYLGVRQDLHDAPCDRLGLNRS